MGEFINQVRRAMPERYVVEREWGAGGAAIVYLAEDVKHGRKVAVKVLRPEVSLAVGSERFQREIEVAARLQHPNIVPVYDSGEAEGLMCFTMPFIEGQTLQDRLAEVKQLSLEEVIEITRDVTSASTTRTPRVWCIATSSRPTFSCPAVARWWLILVSPGPVKPIARA